ncbi:hypothetical protein [Pantanalinema rosaneae]|uniref:hypothetical protein n=1 Tax=Pantanalinema rosaneae TaxID=1620701 RepID=UPI003D6F9D68
MSHITLKVPADTWVKATWEEYLQAIAQQPNDKGKSYYSDGQMRLEISPVGNSHARDHAVIIHAIVLYSGIKGIDLNRPLPNR